MDEQDQRADEADGSALVVPSAPGSVALVRRYAIQTCTALGWGAAADTVALLVTEVATNAVLHAYGPEIRVRVLDRGERLRVEVFDGSPVLPSPRHAPTSGENGRGLGIVHALAAHWGYETGADGKTAWFEIAP